MDQSFTFHDGFKLSKGEKIIFPSLAIHMDPATYSNPHDFDGFRFTKGRERGTEGEAQRSVAASTVDGTFLQQAPVVPNF